MPQGTHRASWRDWHSAQVVLALDAGSGGAGVTIRGGWGPSWVVGCIPRAGSQGSQAEAHWPLSPSVHTHPISWWGLCVVVPVLEPDEEHSTDVILVGSSELSAPASPGPRRGEGSFEYWVHHLGCQPQAWAMSKVPGLWNIHTPRQGQEAPPPSSCDVRSPCDAWPCLHERKAGEGRVPFLFPFPDLAYEVKVNQRDIEGEPWPGKGGSAALTSPARPYAASWPRRRPRRRLLWGPCSSPRTHPSVPEASL